MHVCFKLNIITRESIAQRDRRVGSEGQSRDRIKYYGCETLGKVTLQLLMTSTIIKRKTCAKLQNGLIVAEPLVISQHIAPDISMNIIW